MYHMEINIKDYPDNVDYSYIEACIKSSNFSVLKQLKKRNVKFFNYLDFKNNKYNANPVEIKVDYDDIFEKLKFDPSCFEYI